MLAANEMLISSAKCDTLLTVHHWRRNTQDLDLILTAMGLTACDATLGKYLAPRGDAGP
jgi:hypothetical protein